MQLSLNRPFHSTGHLAGIKRDFYSELKLSRNAVHRQIKESYEAHLKQYQTELAAGAKDAAEKLKRLNKAYSVLGDYEKKRMYDRGLSSFSKDLEEPPVPVSAVSNVQMDISVNKLIDASGVSDKKIKDRLANYLGDNLDTVTWKEKKEIIEGAKELLTKGGGGFETRRISKVTKFPDTHMERAIRKMQREGKIIQK